ncbi:MULTISPECIES: COX15/CtaA family protein [Polaromonas]|uniref:Heme A synthase n=1 Tax=Polaromonas aquatica TaxID=332657 RepID=A0ABW1TXW4_9BURK
MAAQDLYNLSPAIRLMIMGLVVAMGPLAWVWLHNRNATVAQRLRVLTLVTLFLTFDLVIFGAFTRLTDSGLGCPDWPGCYGHASPVGAQMHIEAAQTAMPSGPVTHSKAWIEMVHRYLATGVGVLILTLTVASWVERKRVKISPWWPTATLVWVCLQGAFGALTVTMKLFPAIVTMHLLGGLVLLLLLKAQAVRYAQAQGSQLPVALPNGTRLLVLATFALLWLQIALGGWVSTNYAVLACTDFPSCQGSLWPAMDFSQGFTLWRELGAGHDGANISFQALTAIHYVHRLSAYVVFAAMLALAFRLYRVPALRGQGQWLAGLALLQVATGLGNVLLGWPLLAAVMHTGGAAALVIVLTGIVFCSRAHAPAVDVPSASKLSASRLSA